MKNLLVLTGLLIGFLSNAQDYEQGESIFKANCSACHKMDAKLIGPPLQNTVSEQGFEWAKKWIYNNAELRDAGDAHAIEIFEEYNKQIMPSYSYLSDEELTDLVTYLEGWKNVTMEELSAKNDLSKSISKDTPNLSASVSKDISETMKLIIAAFVFICFCMLVTLAVVYKAFKTIVTVNRIAHKQQMATNSVEKIQLE
jgi:cytochrome c2